MAQLIAGVQILRGLIMPHPGKVDMEGLRDFYEGGIKVPTIGSWAGCIEANNKTDLISVQYDVMATFADIAGFKAPKDTDGISFLPTLPGNTAEQEDHEFFYW